MAIAAGLAGVWGGSVPAQAPAPPQVAPQQASPPDLPQAPSPVPAGPSPASEPAQQPASVEVAPGPQPTPGAASESGATSGPIEVEALPPAKAIVRPTDQVAAKAFDVLETHCARCHQAERLQRLQPAGGFGNILHLDALAGDASVIRPGNPDASRLYTHMLRRLMPFDVYQEQSGGAEPTPEEIQAVRGWIGAMKPAAPACPGRQPLTPEEIAAAIGRAAEKAGWDVGRQRFVTLAHLYNACDSDAALVGWRQAVRRLVNGLSWKPAPVRIEPVDDARTILRIDLGDLGWVGAHWDRIVQSGSNPGGGLIRLAPDLLDALGSKVPVVRGDWLAATVTKAPLYYDLLGLPELGSEIHKILNIDVEAQRRAGSALRTGVRQSRFARGGRLVERFSALRGAMWSTFDAVAKDGQRDPSEAAPSAAVPAHNAVLAHFTLPNGFPAFFALSNGGRRLDQAPGEIARRANAPRGGIRVGVDCMACHSAGVAHGAAVEQPTDPVATAAVGDRTTVRGALAAAGVAAAHSLDGVDPVVALVRRYAMPLTLGQLAAELGVSSEVLARIVATAPGDTGLLARRIQQGGVARHEIENDFANLLAAVGGPAAPPSATRTLPAEDSAAAGPVLQLLADKPAYAQGDALSLSVRTSVDCHLTLVSINGRGRGTVIFPSDFEQNNLLTAGRTLKLPGDGAPYLFRLRDPGRETIVAICSPTGGAIDGIRHDFERQRFTDLGDYDEFLRQAIASEQAERRGQKAPVQTAAETKARGVRRRNPSRPEGADVRPRSEQTARTAITIEIR